MSKLVALSPQEIHATFLLASQKREIEAKRVLQDSFSQNRTDGVFISNQFVNWVTK